MATKRNGVHITISLPKPAATVLDMLAEQWKTNRSDAVARLVNAELVRQAASVSAVENNA